MKKKGLTLNLNNVETAAPKAGLLNAKEDGSVESLNSSIAFNAEGMQNAAVACPFKDLREIKTLGKGSFGRVSLVETPSGQRCALKELFLSGDQATQKNIYKELHSYLDYSHPYIIRTLNLYSQPGDKIYVMLELAIYGSTKDFMRRLKNGYFNEAGLGMIAIDTLRALDYIHRRGIIHRDLKPDNLLLQEDGITKVADFGVATSFLAHDTEQAQQTFAGSISYMAPERFQDQTPYGPSSDIWSLGITFLELLRGTFPYAKFTEFFTAMNAIVNGTPPFLKEEEGFSRDCCALVNAMLAKDPRERLNAGQLLQMPFARKYLAKEADIRPLFAKWMHDNSGSAE